MRLTAKDRILLHLLESAPPEDDAEVPAALTQRGVTRGAEIDYRHLSQSLRPLIQEGFIRERVRHVVGHAQRMRVYDLTFSGRAYAIQLRDNVGAEGKHGRPGDAARETALDQVLPGPSPSASLLGVVRPVDQVGVIDFDRVRRVPQTGTVEQLGDAPRLTTFLGRQGELRELTRSGSEARIFVIRGIAGIGKSALAARACDLLRGRRNLFWHRIRPWESGPAILASLGRFLDALDRPGLSSVLRRGEPGLAGEVLRQDLPDTRSFLVLDDAHDASPEGLVVLRMLAEATTSAPDVRLVVLSRRALPFYDPRDTALTGAVREIELGGLASADAAALLTGGGEPAPPEDLARRLGGHPLLLELVRTHGSDLPRAIHDVRRFMEVTVYRDLSEAERTVMKAASLFQIPVPQRTWLAIPQASYEAFVALQDRSLVRSVGGDRYEMHDTIRDFFGGILSPSESQSLGVHVVAELRRLASESRGSGDFAACVAYVSNALALTAADSERGPLLEALADASARMGDVPGALQAYAQALDVADDPEMRARLHRLSGTLYCEQVEIGPTIEEVRRARHDLADRKSAERGWTDLLLGRIAAIQGDSAESQRRFASALSGFRAFRCPTGEAEARLQLGASVVHAQRDLSEATADLRAALELAGPLHDPALAAEAHGWLGYVAAFGLGDADEALREFEAAEASPAAAANPLLRLRFARFRGFLRLHLQADFEGARAAFEESATWARKCHSERLFEEAKYGLALVEFYQGHWRRCLEALQAHTERRQGFRSPPRMSGAFWTLALCALLEGDVRGFAAAERRFEREASKWKTEGGRAYYLGMRGLARLVKGHGAAAKADLAAAAAPTLDVYPISLRDEVFAPPLFVSLALRLEGRDPDAHAFLRRSREILERQGRQAMRDLLPRMERQLCTVLSKHGSDSKSSGPASVGGHQSTRSLRVRGSG